MTTEAIVFTAPNTVEYREVLCRDPGPGDVVVRTHHSWLSNGTEGSYLRGERSDGDTPYQEGDPAPFPVVAGYQRVGAVESVGREVTGLATGDSVFATVGHVAGMHHDYGGHLLRSVAPAAEVFALPPGDEPLKYAGLVLAQVGWNAGTRPSVSPGDVAVVIGDGLVGHWTAQTLTARGARVIMVGRHRYRLDKFLECGGAATVDAGSAPWLEACRDLAGTNGFRIGVDTVGSIEIMQALSSAMNRFGDLVSAGFYGPDDAFRLQPARYGEHTIHLVSGWTRHRLERTMEAVAEGRILTLPLITHHFPARQAADAWRLIESKSEPVLGVILDWTD